MALSSLLKYLSAGMPLLGALFLWRAGGFFPRRAHLLGAAVLALVGICGTGIFLLERLFRCMFQAGRENCLIQGSTSLGLIILCLVWIVVSLLPRRQRSVDPSINRLLFASVWAGIGFTQNLLVLLLFLYLLYFLVDRWLRSKGLQWRFLVIRDDYRDDIS